ncbi:hypothetical protein AVEN_135773-1 [Araneus ventricosus]|uniref:Uncharacterized protein n=1 Tax=Araneus ventricosus TaxID=182803 RepID=A0A4Y2CCA6_ARAVE|nr:hypothetical protein AVEN_135773-1 [Araneus ventricosus]
MHIANQFITGVLGVRINLFIILKGKSENRKNLEVERDKLTGRRKSCWRMITKAPKERINEPQGWKERWHVSSDAIWHEERDGKLSPGERTPKDRKLKENAISHGTRFDVP